MSGQRLDGSLLLMAGFVLGMTITALMVILGDREWWLAGLIIVGDIAWIVMAVMLLRRMPSSSKRMRTRSERERRIIHIFYSIIFCFFGTILFHIFFLFAMIFWEWEVVYMWMNGTLALLFFVILLGIGLGSPRREARSRL